MTRMRWLLGVVAAMNAPAWLARPAWSDDDAQPNRTHAKRDLTELSLSELADIEVTTVSKKPEPGLASTERLELVAVGQNLLHDHHLEFGTPSPQRTEVQRGFYTEAVLRW